MNQISIEKILIFILILMVVGGIFFLAFSSFSRIKHLELIFPVAGEKLLIEGKYDILWRSRNIDKVGIVLFDGEEPKWIAKDVNANLGKYSWEIQSGQKYGSNYWIAIFEYPNEELSKIDYSKGPFSIIYSDQATCGEISVLKEWLYLPSGFEDTRRVFITEGKYSGDLKGLNGADEICTQEAKKIGLEGNWIAFIGGEKNAETAVERMKKGRKGTDGIFIEAVPEKEISNENYCHRFLAKDFEQFLTFFSDNGAKANERVSAELFKKFTNLWIGRITEKDKTNCIEIITSRERLIEQNYTYTVSCQNWTIEKKIIEDTPSLIELPICYTPQGSSLEAFGLGGFSFGTGGIDGKRCNEKQHILCIED